MSIYSTYLSPKWKFLKLDLKRSTFNPNDAGLSISARAKHLNRKLLDPHYENGDPNIFMTYDILSPSKEDQYIKTIGPMITETYERVYSGIEHSFPDGFKDGYQGLVNAIICFRYAFREKIGLRMDEGTGNVDERLFRRNQRSFLNEVVISEHKHWQNVFMQLKLLSLSNEIFNNCAAKIFYYAYNPFFDKNTEEGKHLHFYDFIIRNSLRSEESIQILIEEASHDLEKHLNIKLIPHEYDAKGKLIRLGEIDERLIPDNDSKYPLRNSKLPKEFGFDDWRDFFIDRGFPSIVSPHGPFRGSIYSFFKTAYPWLFDSKNTPEGKHLLAVHFRQSGMWKGENWEELAHENVGHYFEKHFGLEMRPPSRGFPGIIDKRLLDGDISSFLAANGSNTWDDLRNKMLFTEAIWEEHPDDFPRSPLRVLEWQYPWAFDLRKPEGRHLHIWKLSEEFAWDILTLKKAIIHEVKREGWKKWELFEKISEKWLNDVGLSTSITSKWFDGVYDMINKVFDENMNFPTLIIKDPAIPPEFDLNKPAFVISSSNKNNGTAYIALKDNAYYFSSELAGSLVQLSGNRAMIFEKKEINQYKTRYVYKASFRIEL